MGTLGVNGVVYTSNGNGTLNSETVLSSVRGGTGANLSAANTGALPYFGSLGVMTSLPIGTTGYIFASNGTTPQWTDPAALNLINYWQLTSNVLVQATVPGILPLVEM